MTPNRIQSQIIVDRRCRQLFTEREPIDNIRTRKSSSTKRSHTTHSNHNHNHNHSLGNSNGLHTAHNNGPQPNNDLPLYAENNCSDLGLTPEQQKLKILTELGFDESAARQALQATKHNLIDATTVLMEPSMAKYETETDKEIVIKKIHGYPCWIAFCHRWKELTQSHSILRFPTNHCMNGGFLCEAKSKTNCHAIRRSIFMLGFYKAWDKHKAQNYENEMETSAKFIHENQTPTPLEQKVKHILQNDSEFFTIHVVLKMLALIENDCSQNSNNKSSYFEVTTIFQQIRAFLTDLKQKTKSKFVFNVLNVVEILHLCGFSCDALRGTMSCHRSQIPSLLKAKESINKLFLCSIPFRDLVNLLDNYSFAKLLRDLEHSFVEHASKVPKQTRIETLKHFRDKLAHIIISSPSRPCSIVRRNSRDRHRYDNNNTGNYFPQMRQLFHLTSTSDFSDLAFTVQSIIDEYYSYFVHSSLSLSVFGSTLLQNAYLHANHDDHNIDIDTDMDDDDYNCDDGNNNDENICNLHKNYKSVQQKAFLMRHCRRQQNRYMTTLSKENNDDELQLMFNSKSKQFPWRKKYNFGPEVYFWRTKSDSETVIPLFRDLKSELLENPFYAIKSQIWEQLVYQAHSKTKSQSFRRIRIRWHREQSTEQFGITYASLLSLSHVLVLLTYCNFDVLQRTFKQQWRYELDEECVSDFMKRNEKICHWCRLLSEACMYGDFLRDGQTLYHGVSLVMVWDEADVFLSAPMSTTTDFSVAAVFAHQRKGMIVVLQNAVDSITHSRHFNCEWISAFKEECERLVCLSSLRTMRIHAEQNQSVANAIRNELDFAAMGSVSLAQLQDITRIQHAIYDNGKQKSGRSCSCNTRSNGSRNGNIHNVNRSNLSQGHAISNDEVSDGTMPTVHHNLHDGADVFPCMRLLRYLRTGRYFSDNSEVFSEQTQNLMYKYCCLILDLWKMIDDGVNRLLYDEECFVQSFWKYFSSKKANLNNFYIIPSEWNKLQPTLVKLFIDNYHYDDNHSHSKNNANANNNSVLQCGVLLQLFAQFLNGIFMATEYVFSTHVSQLRLEKMDTHQCYVFGERKLRSVFGDIQIRFKWYIVRDKKCGIVIQISSMPESIQGMQLFLSGKVWNTNYGFYVHASIFDKTQHTFNTYPILTVHDFLRHIVGSQTVDIKIAVALSRVQIGGEWHCYHAINAGDHSQTLMQNGWTPGRKEQHWNAPTISTNTSCDRYHEIIDHLRKPCRDASSSSSSAVTSAVVPIISTPNIRSSNRPARGSNSNSNSNSNNNFNNNIRNCSLDVNQFGPNQNSAQGTEKKTGDKT